MRRLGILCLITSKIRLRYLCKQNTASKATGIRVVPDVVTYDDLVPFMKTEDKQAIMGFLTPKAPTLFIWI